MKEDVKERKIINFLIKIFWIFIIGSVLGFFIEILYVLVYTRTLQIRKGLIYGPFVQVYGMGAIAYYLLVYKIKEPKKLFFAGTIMGGSLEYLCSFFQEIFFGTISWDYTHFGFDLNGRVCLLYCFYWGIIAVVFLKWIYPFLQKIEYLIDNKRVRIFTIFFAIFMTFNISISCMAANRQQERREQIPAKGAIDELLDRKYPDEILNKVYNNKKEV